jgi:hypothetical protein
VNKRYNKLELVGLVFRFLKKAWQKLSCCKGYAKSSAHPIVKFRSSLFKGLQGQGAEPLALVATSEMSFSVFFL